MQTARVLHVFCLQKSYVPPKEKKSFFLENVHVLHCDQQLPSSACYTGHTDTRPKLSFYTRVVRESQAKTWAILGHWLLQHHFPFVHMHTQTNEDPLP